MSPRRVRLSFRVSRGVLRGGVGSRALGVRVGRGMGRRRRKICTWQKYPVGNGNFLEVSEDFTEISEDSSEHLSENVINET